MNIIGENIKYLRKKNGMTQDDLASKMGVSRYKIGSYEEGRAQPKLELLRLLASYFQLTIDALVTHELRKEQRNVNSHKFNEGLKNLHVLTTVVNSDNEERFAIVPEKASAGYTSGYADPTYIEKLPVFDLPLPEFKNSGTYRVFQISGDSMEPVQSGTYIICEYIADIRDVKSGESHIVVTQNDGIVYKRIEKETGNNERLLLKSDNLAYKTYTVNLSDVLEIWRAAGFIATRLPDNRDVSENKIRHLIDELREELDRYGK